MIWIFFNILRTQPFCKRIKFKILEFDLTTPTPKTKLRCSSWQSGAASSLELIFHFLLRDLSGVKNCAANREKEASSTETNKLWRTKEGMIIALAVFFKLKPFRSFVYFPCNFPFLRTYGQSHSYYQSLPEIFLLNWPIRVGSVWATTGGRSGLSAQRMTHYILCDEWWK